jgi:predicted RND superfamily exporter protein
MWSKLADFILRYRWQSLLAIAITTVFFGYYAGKVQLTYDFAKIIPADDPDYIDYIKFKNTFGEDGNVLVIGVQSDKIFEFNFFNDWSNLTKQIEGIDGIEKVVSLSNIQTINRNDSLQTLSLQPLLKSKIENQSQLDSFKNQVADLKFYNGFLYNPESNVTLLAITLKKEKLDSKERIPLVNSIEQAADAFGKKYGCEMHYSGLPYVRTVMSSKVADEIKIFIYLSILVTAIFIFVFFRFISAVILSLVVVIVGVICTVGTIALFGYKISLLTGIIPPLMVIVGVQNCIYLLFILVLKLSQNTMWYTSFTKLIANC